MEWYYAIHGQQHGPVDSPAIQTLLREGVIGPGSKVWRAGMADWQAYGTVAAEIEADAAGAQEEGRGAGEMGVCAYSGEVLPKSEMLQYGDRWIAARHKDDFVQALHEGRDVLPAERVADMVYVGFWWRVLASVIDWGVKLLPSTLVSAPYFYFYFKAVGVAFDPTRVVGDSGELFGEYIIPLALSGALMFFGYVGISMFYETWMVGKYGGTVGKLALGFRVVNIDGTMLSYLKAWGRWWAEVLTKTIMWIASYVGGILGAVLMVGRFGGAGQDLVAVVYLIAGVFAIVGGFGYWMAARSPEKKTLHDIICSTRVVRKEP